MQSIAWDVFKSLASRGHRVTLITTRIPGRPDTFVADGVAVLCVENSLPEKYTNSWWTGSEQLASSLHQETPIDAVLSVSSAAAGLKNFRRVNQSVKFVFQAHGTSWGEFQSKWASRKPLQILKSVKNLYWIFKDAFIYRMFDEIVLIGDVLEVQFNAWPMKWIASGVRTRTIRNGVDRSSFAGSREMRECNRLKLEIPLSAKTFVFAARLHPQKGAHEALNIFELLADSDSETFLLIVGGGESEGALKNQASRSRHVARIRFCGAVERSEIPGLLACADIFIFPTLRREGLPMNVLEALASGLPVVTSESMRGLFLHHPDIHFIDPADTESAAKICLGLAAVAPQAVRSSLLPPEYDLESCVLSYEAALKPARG
ncbi:glycosyltransferase family 4 protein [Aquincola tertiaricarbonis]|uniref:Glycosyltransferase family 4 protein n=1 Tax=Aquincola tertiaricarbonis TaxID=391953 RepID=A0ABY4SLP6_AQUTE|nr:glycosyltransferase family 4 protein [Aquincola tertiaricarbonis]URI11931.1 glycosyltransferase family 4 protein [Aquincola tertiaricarbonis]